MQTRKNPKNGDEISLLGFGCMRLPRVSKDSQDIDVPAAQAMIDYAYAHGVNYFDTAYPYHGGKSEPFIGPALKKYPRESYFLATKMPSWLVKTLDDAVRIFNEQLARCGVDYFDYYLCHALSEEHFATYQKVDIYGFLRQMKKEGKIRNLGFSFHDKPEKLTEILDWNEWDFVQLQLNYLDWEMQDAKTQYEILEARGIPCIVMEPVRGGALVTLNEEATASMRAARPEESVASWAMRFAGSLPDVITVLSGMSNMEQVQDNVRTMERFEPLSGEEREMVFAAAKTYREAVTVPCTGCRYCMDCPAGVDIPQVFAVYNKFALSKNNEEFLNEYRSIDPKARASSCVGCKKCMEHCPQGIVIPDRLGEIQSKADSLAG